MRPRINRPTAKLLLQTKRTRRHYVLDPSGTFSKASEHQKQLFFFLSGSVSVHHRQELVAFLPRISVCGGVHAAQEPIWMAPRENASLKCVIPEQPGSCVWWRELGFIIASAGDGMSPERERHRDWKREGGRRRDTILTVWMIHHMIVLDRAVLSDCLYCTLQLSSISQALVDWFITLNKTAID